MFNSDAPLIEIDAPLSISKNIMDAIGILQPEGPARILLADALSVARDMVEWFRVLQNGGTGVSPSWTAFVHSNGYRTGKDKEVNKEKEVGNDS